MTGEAIIAFATLTESNTEEEDELVKELRLLVRGEIGPFAAPDMICITPLLPMVSSVWCLSLLVKNNFSLMQPYPQMTTDKEWQDHEKSLT